MEREVCPSCGSRAEFEMLEGKRGLGVAQLYHCSECGKEITRCTVCGKPIVWGLQCVRCASETAGNIFSIFNPLARRR